MRICSRSCDSVCSGTAIPPGLIPGFGVSVLALVSCFVGLCAGITAFAKAPPATTPDAAFPIYRIEDPVPGGYRILGGVVKRSHATGRGMAEKVVDPEEAARALVKPARKMGATAIVALRTESHGGLGTWAWGLAVEMLDGTCQRRC